MFGVCVWQLKIACASLFGEQNKNSFGEDWHSQSWPCSAFFVFLFRQSTAAVPWEQNFVQILLPCLWLAASASLLPLPWMIVSHGALSSSFERNVDDSNRHV
jgi:hypothetical protein